MLTPAAIGLLAAQAILNREYLLVWAPDDFDCPPCFPEGEIPAKKPFPLKAAHCEGVGYMGPTLLESRPFWGGGGDSPSPPWHWPRKKGRPPR